jgi:hypothetical protein
MLKVTVKKEVTLLGQAALVFLMQVDPGMAYLVSGLAPDTVLAFQNLDDFIMVSWVDDEQPLP